MPFSQKNGAATPGYVVYLDSVASRLRLYMEDASGNALFCYNASGVSTGSWSMVTVTYDDSKSTAGVKFYINGTLGTTTTVTNTFSGTATNSTAAKMALKHRDGTLMVNYMMLQCGVNSFQVQK